MGVSKPQDEAIDILKAVLGDFFGGSFDIKNALRRCAHVCQILGWSEQLSWFQNELFGYPEGVELPQHRKKIKGRTEWLVAGGLNAVVASVVDDQYRTTAKPTQYTEMDARAGIDWILSAAQSGYVESTGKKSSKYISFQHENVETNEARIYDKSVFQTIVTNIENLVFRFVSDSYAVLCYSDVLQDIWQEYRTKTDEHLMPIGLSKHLDTIRNGLNSGNPQEWRNAMWSCRDILHDLAAYLWRDQRKTYEHLPGKGENDKLEVTDRHYVNRLGAYLHQKGIDKECRAYLSAEMERIYNSIKTLNELDSKAHGKITLHDARSAAIGTYIILGELVTRTDMQPITEYRSP
jgi:hypothetical protein